MRVKATRANNVLRIVSLAVMFATVVSASSLVKPTPAAAWLHLGQTTQYPSAGGKWTYGFWDAKVRSYYYHPDRCHGLSVVYNNNSLVRSIDTAPGYTSIAEQWAINYPQAYDAYYYRVC